MILVVILVLLLFICTKRDSYDNEKILLTLPDTGIGDKFLNLLGAVVISKIQNKHLDVIPHQKDAPDRGYDMSLFEFDSNLTVVDTSSATEKIEFIHASVGSCPYKIHKAFPNVPYDEIMSLFIKHKNCIRPSEKISKYIPSDMNQVYGIHLRATDKIMPGGDPSHVTTPREYEIIIDALKKDVLEIKSPRFFIASEDVTVANNFKQFIKDAGASSSFVEFDVSPEDAKLTGFRPVLDFFALSKCKKIFQGIKHTGLSLLASIIGDVPLVNYSHLCESPELCLINLWKGLANVNGKVDENESTASKSADRYVDLKLVPIQI